MSTTEHEARVASENTLPRPGRIALLGYCVESMEAAKRLGYDFLCVVPPGFDALLEKDGISAVSWEFGRLDENSGRLAQRMEEMGVRLAVPLYEETVEWAGTLNAQFLDNPRLFNRSMLFRDKAMMKRKAQMSGIRVGVFEEVRRAQELPRRAQRSARRPRDVERQIRL
jgi:hypothetical protein